MHTDSLFFFGGAMQAGGAFGHCRPAAMVLQQVEGRRALVLGVFRRLGECVFLMDLVFKNEWRWMSIFFS